MNRRFECGGGGKKNQNTKHKSYIYKEKKGFSKTK